MQHFHQPLRISTHSRPPTHACTHPFKKQEFLKSHILQAYTAQMCLKNSHFTHNDSFNRNSNL